MNAGDVFYLTVSLCLEDSVAVITPKYAFVHYFFLATLVYIIEFDLWKTIVT